nr:MAG TPA: hypothetical protein [Caudoviricetes sp.]
MHMYMITGPISIRIHFKTKERQFLKSCQTN